MQITDPVQEIQAFEAILESVQPVVAELRQELNAMTERKRNEKRFRDEQRKRVERQLKEALATIASMAGDAQRRREELDVLRTDVEQLRASIADEEREVVQGREQIQQLQQELQQLSEAMGSVAVSVSCWS